MALVLWLPGCMSPEVLAAKRATFQNTIPRCSTERGCEIRWAAARRWVIQNAGWKIQTYSSDYIETYNPARDSPRIAVRVTKEPLPQGGYELVAYVWCNNIFGCQPNSWDAAIAFNRYVRSAGNMAAR